METEERVPSGLNAAACANDRYHYITALQPSRRAEPDNQTGINTFGHFTLSLEAFLLGEHWVSEMKVGDKA